MSTPKYQPRKEAMAVEEIDAFIKNECLPIVNDKINALSKKILDRKKMKNHNFAFGPIQARELALRMFERTGGDILL